MPSARRGFHSRLLLQLLTVALAAAGALVPVPATIVEERFSTSIYPAIQRALTPLTNSVPWALLDALIMLAGVWLVAVIAGAARTAWRRRAASPLLSAAWRLVSAGSLAYLLFLCLWGFNYRRIPVGERLEQATGTPSDEAVVSLGRRIVANLNQLYGEAHRVGWPEDVLESQDLRRSFVQVQQRLTGAAPAAPGRLKQTLLAPYFRWATVDGMINPFGLEVLANPDLLPFERPFVAAHEWSHLAGFADEAEASFVGWISCVRADVPSRYSGWLYLYWQVSGEVTGVGRTELSQALAEGPRRDVELIADRLRRAQLPWLRTASWRIYDQYLKANRVDAGIRSYDLVVTLILQARFADDWMPETTRSRQNKSGRGL